MDQGELDKAASSVDPILLERQTPKNSIHKRGRDIQESDPIT